jgi:hypothetical protein
MNVPATVQTIKMLEQRFTEFDVQVHPRISDFFNEDSDDDDNIDMLQSTNMQTIDFDDWSSESSNALGLEFDSLTVEDGHPDEENWAPTPTYVDPSTLELNSQEEIQATQYAITYHPTIRQRTSNEIIDDINRQHREYVLNGMFGMLISPKGSRVPTPGASGALQEDEVSLDWGSNEERYTSFSLNTHNADCLTVSDQTLSGLKDGLCKNVVVQLHVN